MENKRLESQSATLIHNARLVNEGEVSKGYVLIQGQFIAATGRGEVPDHIMAKADENIDADGAMLLPGVIDEHVHFRDPGLTHKAEMATESRAAVAGGVTSFIDMPNTKPMTVTRQAVDDKMAHAARVSSANYGFFIGATNDNIDELLQADYTKVAGIKLFLGSSTGNMLVDSESTLRRLFAEAPALIAVHAEDESVIRANRDAVVERYGEELEIEFHPVIRSHRACIEATRHAVELAEATGARLHVLHISTADELKFFSRGPVASKRITAETCPQYLLFSDEQYAQFGSRIKCNPAIKHPEDREALRKAVDEGVIDVIATDHAPHLISEKMGTALTAVSGIPMIQFSLPVMLELASEGVFSLPAVVEKMAHNPATLFGIDRRGFIRPGYYADLVLVDEQDEPYTVERDMILSKCGWSPIEGLPLRHKVLMTFVNGQIAYRYGVIFANIRGTALKFSQNL